MSLTAGSLFSMLKSRLKFIILQPWDWSGLPPTEPLSQGVDLNMVLSGYLVSRNEGGQKGKVYLFQEFLS